jgi:hypothetical protein
MNVKIRKDEATLRHCNPSCRSIFMSVFLSLFLLTANIFAISLSTPVQISNGALQAGQGMVVSNPSGDAAASWIINDDYGTNSVQVAMYSSGAWGSPSTLAIGMTPSVAINGSGDAVAVWLNPPFPSDGVYPQIWGSLYNHYSGTWSTPAQISTTTTFTHSPKVVIDEVGNAFAVWTERCACSDMCTCYLVGAATYSSSSGTWLTPTFFTDCQGNTKHSQFPSIHINSLGQVMTFWTERLTSTDAINIAGKAYENTVWNVANVIASTMATSCIYYGGIDESGNAMVVWEGCVEGGGTNIQCATYSNRTWSGPSIISDEPVTILFGYTPEGNGLLVWCEPTGEGYIVKGMNYNNGTWGSVINISSQVGIRGGPAMSTADGNNATLVWSNEAAPGILQIIAMSNGSWGQVVSEETNLGRTPCSYNISVNSDGQVVVVWDDTINESSVIMAVTGTI